MIDRLHNNPPSVLEFCAETTAELGLWLEDHPVIETEDEARAGKLLVDRATSTMADAEHERDKLVRPLNAQVKEINVRYRSPCDSLGSIKGILKERLQDYIRAETQKREATAEAKRREVEEAERRARDAEERERTSIDEARMGVVNAGQAEARIAADVAFSAYERAEREAARAEKETHVKIGGGFKKALSTRTKEILVLHNWQRAIDEMGLSEALIEAILKEARAFRKSYGVLPHGVAATTEEVIR